MAPSAQFELAQPPSDAVSSIAFAPGSSSRIIASSWDKNVYLYSIDGERSEEGVQGSLIRTFEHRAPVMSVCFGASDAEAFSAGMDWQVSRIDLDSGDITALSKHTAPVRQVVYSREHSLLISASWDSTLHIHKTSDPSSTPLTISLPAKPHALAASPSKVVVAMTARLVHIYDLATLSAAVSTPSEQAPQPWQTRESSLKFLTRAVAAMPSDAGYATSSIEGRVSVEWFDDSAESQARKYAFKCHRQTSAEGTDVVYPVNALAFHPAFGTFASGGGDTTVALWDAEAKRRMKIYPKFPESVAALAFSTDGRYLAIATCPGFETGMEDYSGEGRTRILIRELSETEARPKGAK
ncbi:mitotic checkpoint protein BUB3 [Microdochium bolleyi]|uniref:Mitotic checkpoint protein BUB3 n=1 Tax=Microdochium bolleyi TaxID=196109 RepID=A0A136IKL6_9PEZI|nr:mitotic checkpoint protein BUB3 [Microdochium bolleyi]